MTFLGWLSDPVKGLSDLQLGDEKGHFESPGKCIFRVRNPKVSIPWFQPVTIFDLVSSFVMVPGTSSAKMSWTKRAGGDNFRLAQW